MEDNWFGYDLIRNDILRDVLGKEHDSMLYWVGKSLARKYPLQSTEELITFFEKANWGMLELIQEKRHEYTFKLSGSWMGKLDSRCYQLEAGFLAQQLDTWKDKSTGASYSTHKGNIIIEVEIDRG